MKIHSLYRSLFICIWHADDALGKYSPNTHFLIQNSLGCHIDRQMAYILRSLKYIQYIFKKQELQTMASHKIVLLWK